MGIYNRKGWYIFWIIWSFAFMVWDIVTGIGMAVSGDGGAAAFQFLFAGVMLLLGYWWIRLYQERKLRGGFKN